MSAVRNVGEGVVAQIVAAREAGGPFTDFYDFCDRVDPSVLNKRTIESLVKAGGFDSLGHPRQGLVQVFETIVDTVIDRRRNEAEGQFDLFSSAGDAHVEAVVGHRVEIPDVEFPKSQRLLFEKEMLGLYVSDHPLMGAERSLRRHVDATLGELREGREGELRVVGGIVTTYGTRWTRRGELMGSFVLEDLTGVLEVMVFPRTMTEYGHVLENDAIVVVKGRLDLRDDSPKLVAMEVMRPEIAIDGGPPVRIRVKLHALTDDKAARLKGILGEHPGDSPVFVHLEAPEKTTVLRLGDELGVDPGNGLFAELRVLLGADCLL
jgi:DNA polymerase-3 subunit alpha